jgi:hypothetical protein
LVVRTLRSYHKIEFPVFKVSDEPLIVDGLVFVNGRVVDDRNVPAETLGQRRLLTPHKLAKIKHLRGNIVELIADNVCVEGWYLDRLGDPFKYKRTKKLKVITHKINKVVYRNTHSILIVDGVNFPILVERPPSGSFTQILYYKEYPWKLYSISDEWKKPTYKKA